MDTAKLIAELRTVAAVMMTDGYHGTHRIMRLSADALEAATKERDEARAELAKIRSTDRDFEAEAMAARQEADGLRAELAEANEHLEELKSLFDLQHRRIVECGEMWQKALGKPGVFPDLGTLLTWLSERIEAQKAELAALREQTRVRATATEPPQGDGEVLALAWERHGVWGRTPARVVCQFPIEFPYWLPVPPKPESEATP